MTYLKADRDPWFDNARIILVALVVFGHVLENYRFDSGLLFFFNNFLSLVRMPALIFLCGYFAKRWEREGYIFEVFKKLLFPYFVFQIIFHEYYSWLYGWDRDLRLLMPEYTLWFLLSLVSWNVLLVVFRGSKLLFPASLFLMLFSGSVSIIDNFASLQRTFVFLPFFLLGYFCPKDLVFRVRKRSIALPIVCFLFSGWCFYLTFDQPWFGRDMVLGYKPYLVMGLDISEGIFYRGVVFSLSILSILAFFMIIPEKVYFFTYLGRRTAYIYIFHGVLIKTLFYFGAKEFATGYGSVGLVFCIVVMLVIILGGDIFVRIMSPVVEGRLIQRDFWLRLRGKIPG